MPSKRAILAPVKTSTLGAVASLFSDETHDTASEDIRCCGKTCGESLRTDSVDGRVASPRAVPSAGSMPISAGGGNRSVPVPKCAVDRPNPNPMGAVSTSCRWRLRDSSGSMEVDAAVSTGAGGSRVGAEPDRPEGYRLRGCSLTSCPASFL